MASNWQPWLEGCGEHECGSKLEEPSASGTATIAQRLVLDLAATGDSDPVDALVRTSYLTELWCCTLHSWTDWNHSRSLDHRTHQRANLLGAVHCVGNPAYPGSLALLDGGSLTSVAAIRCSVMTARSLGLPEGRLATAGPQPLEMAALSPRST